MTAPIEVHEGVVLNSLKAGSLVDVETKNRHYQMEFLGGNVIRISGHPAYCPTPVIARFEGSIDQRGELEAGLVGRGMRLMFFLDDLHPVTTSSIVSVHVPELALAS